MPDPLPDTAATIIGLETLNLIKRVALSSSGKSVEQIQKSFQQLETEICALRSQQENNISEEHIKRIITKIQKAKDQTNDLDLEIQQTRDQADDLNTEIQQTRDQADDLNTEIQRTRDQTDNLASQAVNLATITLPNNLKLELVRADQLIRLDEYRSDQSHNFLMIGLFGGSSSAIVVNWSTTQGNSKRTQSSVTLLCILIIPVAFFIAKAFILSKKSEKVKNEIFKENQTDSAGNIT